jgi:hypothetical protein
MPKQRELASGAAVGCVEVAHCGGTGARCLAVHGGVTAGPLGGTAAADSDLARQLSGRSCP